MADDSSTTTPNEGATPDTPAQDAPDSFKSDESKTRVLADLASERDKRQSLEARLKEFEDRDKSESERLTERATANESRATTAELAAMRLEVALDKGLTKTQAKRLVGTTLDELAADADDLLADFGKTETPTVTRRPTERLRGGSEPEQEPEEKNLDKLAARIYGR